MEWINKSTWIPPGGSLEIPSKKRKDSSERHSIGSFSTSGLGRGGSHLKLHEYFWISKVKLYMGVSKNRGTPKSSILIRLSIINHPFWGTPIFGNTHIWKEILFPMSVIFAVSICSNCGECIYHLFLCSLYHPWLKTYILYIFTYPGRLKERHISRERTLDIISQQAWRLPGVGFLDSRHKQHKPFTTWWFQPILNICSSNWIISPRWVF